MAFLVGGLVATPATSVAVNNVSVSTTTIASDSCTDKDCYEVFQGVESALGSQFDSFKDAQDLTGFINALVGFAIGIAGVLAVGMIMYEGFLYMSTDNVSTKSSARSKIVNTVAGFVLLLSIYTLLRTINPDLLVLMPNIDGVALQTGAVLSSSSFEKITGEPLEEPGSYDDLIKQTAEKYNSDYCALRVIVQNETKGNAAVVGQDENVPSSGVASRRAFIASGKKYSGSSFGSKASLLTDRKFCNDAAGCIGKVPDPDSPTLGLDWRFSKGIGLTQITFFPDDYANFTINNYKPKESNKNVVPKRTFSFPWGETVTVTALEMFTPSKNLEISAKLWNAGIQKCGNPKGAFYTYLCGACSCQGSYAQNEVTQRNSQYVACKNP